MSSLLGASQFLLSICTIYNIDVSFSCCDLSHRPPGDTQLTSFTILSFFVLSQPPLFTAATDLPYGRRNNSASWTMHEEHRVSTCYYSSTRASARTRACVATLKNILDAHSPSFESNRTSTHVDGETREMSSGSTSCGCTILGLEVHAARGRIKDGEREEMEDWELEYWMVDCLKL